MQAETLSDADIDVLFATIGKYVVIFQHIEGVLDQILLLGWDDENWSASQIKLSEMTNKQKVDAMENMVLTSPVFARARARQVWCAYFKEVVKRLHDERQRRNSVVHSQYLFE